MRVKITVVVWPTELAAVPRYWMQAGVDDYDETMTEGDVYEMVKVEPDDR